MKKPTLILPSNRSDQDSDPRQLDVYKRQALIRGSRPPSFVLETPAKTGDSIVLDRELRCATSAGTSIALTRDVKSDPATKSLKMLLSKVICPSRKRCHELLSIPIALLANPVIIEL